jgi:hypothetical protein
MTWRMRREGAAMRAWNGTTEREVAGDEAGSPPVAFIHFNKERMHGCMAAERRACREFRV